MSFRTHLGLGPVVQAERMKPWAVTEDEACAVLTKRLSDSENEDCLLQLG